MACIKDAKVVAYDRGDGYRGSIYAALPNIPSEINVKLDVPGCAAAAGRRSCTCGSRAWGGEAGGRRWSELRPSIGVPYSQRVVKRNASRKFMPANDF